MAHEYHDPCAVGILAYCAWIFICQARLLFLLPSFFSFFLFLLVSLFHPETLPQVVRLCQALLSSLSPARHAYAKDLQCLFPGHYRHGWRHAVSCACSAYTNNALLILSSFGFDISSISAIIGTNQYVEYFNNPSGTVQGGIGAALAGGSVIGAIMAGPVSNRIGRRDAIAFACFWWLLGTAIQAGCNGVGMLVAGRFINGICVGITSSQVPVYLVEITKKERRGSIVVIQQWAIEWGIFCWKWLFHTSSHAEDIYRLQRIYIACVSGM